MQTEFEPYLATETAQKKKKNLGGNLKIIRTLLILLALAGSAFAWPACNGNWVQVPTGTTGGIIYVTGDHLTFQCQPKTPPTPPPTPNPNPINTNSNTNNNTNSATSSSNSSSSSTATANQSQSQRQSQGQSQTATGGNANSDATAANNGNNSNNSVTNIEAAKIPVNTAYAPSVFPTVNCSKGYSAGVQTGLVGMTGSAGKVDENCAILEAAGRARTLLAYCKVYITNKYVRKAKVTLEDCMTLPPPAPVVPSPVAPVPVVHEMPLPAPPSPPVSKEVISMDCARFDNVCKEKLDGIALLSKQRYEGQIKLVGDVKKTGLANRMREYLKTNGVGSVLTQLSDEGGDSIEILYVN